MEQMQPYSWIKFGQIFEIDESGVRPTALVEELKDMGVIEDWSVEKLGEGLWRATICDEDECFVAVINVALGSAEVKIVGDVYTKGKSTSLDELREMNVVRVTEGGGYLYPVFAPDYETFKV